MPSCWSITPEWAQLESGTPEERACFAQLGITAYGASLTVGHDRLLQTIRDAPYLSAYHLAEWLLWNWWRLRWEPQKNSHEWLLSHAMSSIGGGYIWPNIQIISDGPRITLFSQPTTERVSTPWRYLVDAVSVLSATDFENGVDDFIDTVMQRLHDAKCDDTNVQQIWQDLQEERQDPSLSRLRKFEALLGEDPDDLDEKMLNLFQANATLTGESALEEIAANRISGQRLPDVPAMIALAHKEGKSTNPLNRVSLQTPIPEEEVAWRLGKSVAECLRQQEGVHSEQAISNNFLAELYGVRSGSLAEDQGLLNKTDLSFSLTEHGQKGKVLFRSQWEQGRRFELARLLGDALIFNSEDAMCVASRSNTYRQKVQRAFAAELLSPYTAVEAMLNGDYSSENQEDVACYFQVSELTILTQLVNHGKIDRAVLE